MNDRRNTIAAHVHTWVDKALLHEPSLKVCACGATMTDRAYRDSPDREARDAAYLLPPLEHAPHSGCLNCGSKPLRVPLRYNPHPGFGLVTLTRDGETIEYQGRFEESTTFIHLENVAKKDRDHDWRVRSDGPLSDVTWQRHGPKEWVAVEKGLGFA